MHRSALAPSWLGPLCGWIASCLLMSAPAGALGVGDITPLYFDGIGGQGFDATDVAGIARGIDFSATPGDDWYAAGDASFDLDLAVDQLTLTPQQNPGSPSFANPIIADAVWSVSNVSAGTLIAPLLVFTSVDPLGLYPVALPPTGLDADGLDLLAYSFGGDDYVYGAILLPDLAEGQSVQVNVRYVVAGAVDSGNLDDVLPPLALAVLGSYQVVPEPGSVGLVGLGLVALAWRRRGRR